MNQELLEAARIFLDATANHLNLSRQVRGGDAQCLACTSKDVTDRALGIRHVYGLSFRGDEALLCSRCIGNFNSVSARRGGSSSLCISTGMQRYGRNFNNSLDEVDQIQLADWLAKKLLKQSRLQSNG